MSGGADGCFSRRAANTSSVYPANVLSEEIILTAPLMSKSDNLAATLFARVSSGVFEVLLGTWEFSVKLGTELDEI